MPYSNNWVSNEVALEHRGVTVYHVYRNNELSDGARTYIFTTDEDGHEEDGFDVRNFDTWTKPDFSKVSEDEHVLAQLRIAIDRGLLGEANPDVDTADTLFEHLTLLSEFSGHFRDEDDYFECAASLARWMRDFKRAGVDPGRLHVDFDEFSTEVQYTITIAESFHLETSGAYDYLASDRMRALCPDHLEIEDGATAKALTRRLATLHGQWVAANPGVAANARRNRAAV